MYVRALEFSSRHYSKYRRFAMAAEAANLQEERFMACRLFAAVVVALLLVCVPGSLAAMEKETFSTDPVVEWLSGVWSDFAAWLSLASDNDGSCSLDPDGCPGGAAPPSPALEVDGRCSLDPDGCPDGQ